jgi:predicted transcriptional regulator
MESNDIDISTAQRRMLTAIVDAHADEDSPVSSSRVAELIDRSPGTVKNQMKQLTTLDLVDSVRGPTGGYRPNENTYAVLGKEPLEEQSTVNLAREFKRVDVTVSEIDFTNVHHPTECRAHVHFQEGITGVDVGDPLAIGPTPVFDLVLAGEVLATSETADRILLSVTTVESPLAEP